MKLLIKRLDPELSLPQYALTGDAGMDLVAAEDVTLKPGERAAVPTGIAVAIPEGHAGLVLPRSGLAARHEDGSPMSDVELRDVWRVACSASLRVTPLEIRACRHVSPKTPIAIVAMPAKSTFGRTVSSRDRPGVGRRAPGRSAAGWRAAERRPEPADARAPRDGDDDRDLTEHTLELAALLHALRPEDADGGSISTLPLAWREPWPTEAHQRAVGALRRLAEDPPAVVVPAHGPPVEASDVAALARRLPAASYRVIDRSSIAPNGATSAIRRACPPGVPNQK